MILALGICLAVAGIAILACWRIIRWRLQNLSLAAELDLLERKKRQALTQIAFEGAAARARIRAGQYRRPPAAPPNTHHGTSLTQVAVAVAIVMLSAGTLLIADTIISAPKETASINIVPAVKRLTYSHLRAGDCLRGSKMHLNGSGPWPHLVTAVPCSDRHRAEVFYTTKIVCIAFKPTKKNPGGAPLYKTIKRSR